MRKMTVKGWALLGLIICFLCNLAYVSSVQAAEIIRETFEENTFEHFAEKIRSIIEETEENDNR